MRYPARIVLLAAAHVLVAAAYQHGSTTNSNPATGPAHEAAGAKLYRSQCANCHGIDGTGTGQGPDLSTGAFRHGGTDEALYNTIFKGVPGTPMPAFKLAGQGTWQLVTYLRALGVGRGGARVKGDVQNGARLFEASGCKNCHTAGGDGGLIGPDLKDVAMQQSAPGLRAALVEPSSSVAPRYWRASVRLASGSTVEGTRLNEDTHSIQLRNQAGKLISVPRSDIAESKILRDSPMPSFAKRLSATEIDDLLAWMFSLRGAQ